MKISCEVSPHLGDGLTTFDHLRYLSPLQENLLDHPQVMRRAPKSISHYLMIPQAIIIPGADASS